MSMADLGGGMELFVLMNKFNMDTPENILKDKLIAL